MASTIILTFLAYIGSIPFLLEYFNTHMLAHLVIFGKLVFASYQFVPGMVSAVLEQKIKTTKLCKSSTRLRVYTHIQGRKRLPYKSKHNNKCTLVYRGNKW